MDLSWGKREWTEIALISVLSFFLYQWSILVLFCLPLQVLYIRRGERKLLYASLLVFAAIVVAVVLRMAKLSVLEGRRSLYYIELLLPLVFLGGLFATDYQWKRVSRRLYKLLLTTAAVGALSVPVILALNRNGQIETLLANQVGAMMEVFFGAAEEGSVGNFAAVELLQNPDRLVDLITSVLLRSFVFMYFVILAVCLWYGSSLGQRSVRVATASLSQFSVPERLLWPLLLSWALVLLDRLVPLGALRFVAWNSGLIMLFVFGMQGIGIILSFFYRRGISRIFRTLTMILLVFALFWPGFNLVVIFGLPGLGVSEVWIPLRKNQKE